MICRERNPVVKMWNEPMETLEGTALEQLQLERLKRTVSRVWDARTPYRVKMEEAGLTPESIRSLDDLERFPFTRKADYRANYPLGMIACPMEEIVRLHASSGTTGSRTVVGYTKNDLAMWAELVSRFATAAGVTNGDIVQISFTYGLFTGGFGLHYGLENLGAAVLPASGGNSELQFSLMRDLRPTVLVATPTYALHLAEVAKDHGYSFDEGRLKIGLFGAEPWGEGIRERIQERTGMLATDNYGLSEVLGPGIAGECSSVDGMHVADDHFIIEVIDPETGWRLPDMEMGEVVLTTLTREGVPIVRFRTGDLSYIWHKPCDCGRRNTRMRKVLGRSDDMLIIRGVNVYPSNVEKALLEVNGIEPHFQIVVDRKGELDMLEVLVEVSEGLFSDNAMEMLEFSKKVEAHLKSALNVRAQVILKEPNSIERTPGKTKWIVDRREL